jgi:hypothetical protein
VSFGAFEIAAGAGHVLFDCTAVLIVAEEKSICVSVRAVAGRSFIFTQEIACARLYASTEWCLGVPGESRRTERHRKPPYAACTRGIKTQRRRSRAPDARSMETAVHAFALALVVCGAVIHALWNVLAKSGSGGPLFVWSYSAASAVI